MDIFDHVTSQREVDDMTFSTKIYEYETSADHFKTLFAESDAVSPSSESENKYDDEPQLVELVKHITGSDDICVFRSNSGNSITVAETPKNDSVRFVSNKLFRHPDIETSIFEQTHKLYPNVQPSSTSSDKPDVENQALYSIETTPIVKSQLNSAFVPLSEYDENEIEKPYDQDFIYSHEAGLWAEDIIARYQQFPFDWEWNEPLLSVYPTQTVVEQMNEDDPSAGFIVEMWSINKRENGGLVWVSGIDLMNTVPEDAIIKEYNTLYYDGGAGVFWDHFPAEVRRRTVGL
jgi:hypothetical protein